MESTSGSCLLQAPCLKQREPKQVRQDHLQSDIEYFQGLRLHRFSGYSSVDLPQYFIFFFFLIVIFFLYFKLCPLPLSLSLDVNEKNLFIGVSPQVFILVDKIPLSLLLSSLSLSLYDKSLIYLCGPLLHLLQYKHVSFVL